MGFAPSRRFVSDGFGWLQNCPNMAQGGPEEGIKETQDGPTSAQERPKTTLRGKRSGSRGAKNIEGTAGHIEGRC